jgi:hypothetical protein
MSEFVGRTGSLRVYSYPETRRVAATPTPFARNFATGPKNDASIADGIQITWNLIDSTGTSGTDVPITPQSTGVVLISGVVSAKNTSGGPVSGIVVVVQVNGVNLPIPVFQGFAPLLDVGDTGEVSIPFLAETNIPVGTTRNIQIFVTGAGGTLIGESSSINVQEVAVATG